MTAARRGTTASTWITTARRTRRSWSGSRGSRPLPATRTWSTCAGTTSAPASPEPGARARSVRRASTGVSPGWGSSSRMTLRLPSPPRIPRASTPAEYKDKFNPYPQCANGAASSAGNDVQPLPDGTLLIPVSCGGNTYLSESRDEGRSWTDPERIPQRGDAAHRQRGQPVQVAGDALVHLHQWRRDVERRARHARPRRGLAREPPTSRSAPIGWATRSVAWRSTTTASARARRIPMGSSPRPATRSTRTRCSGVARSTTAPRRGRCSTTRTTPRIQHGRHRAGLHR